MDLIEELVHSNALPTLFNRELAVEATTRRMMLR